MKSFILLTTTDKEHRPIMFRIDDILRVLANDKGTTLHVSGGGTWVVREDFWEILYAIDDTFILPEKRTEQEVLAEYLEYCAQHPPKEKSPDWGRPPSQVAETVVGKSGNESLPAEADKVLAEMCKQTAILKDMKDRLANHFQTRAEEYKTFVTDRGLTPAPLKAIIDSVRNH
jgi:hypothetical protein